MLASGINQDHREWLGMLVPAGTALVLFGWHLRGWWDRKAQGERITGNLRELHPPPVGNFWDVEDEPT